ncbi:unnamed protein product [Caenorhabditis angaria]|uniref:Uncharacterized protein n=1 Tax=Caenorhabditis angaria TaxID=860376 RepID=A0A9P1N6B8_9PELO|nr:unnamed protein product [Caenorhabditis angaria]
MSYNCMEIVGPDGIMVCHWMQAQYLLFQHLVADVNCSKHKKIRKQVMEILKNMESGYYISLEELEIIIKNFKTEKSIYLRKVNLETPLTIIHNNKFDEMIPRTFFMDLLQIITEEYFLEEPGGGGEFEFLARMFLNWLKIEGDLKEIESWKARYVLMNYWISNFFGDKEKDTRCNILFAFTVSLPFVKLPNAKTLKMWKVSILEGENCCVEYSRMNQCVENMKICQKTNKNFKWTDLVRIHEKGASFIASNPRKEALMKKLIEDKDKKTTEEVLDKIVEKFTENVLPFIKEEGEFRKIGKLGELIRKKMDKEYIDGFEEIMKSCKGLAKLEERLGVFLDFKILNFKEHFYKRKDIIVELERLKFAGNLEN